MEFTYMPLPLYQRNNGSDLKAAELLYGFKHVGTVSFTICEQGVVMETLQHDNLDRVSTATMLRWLFWSGVFASLLYVALA